MIKHIPATDQHGRPTTVSDHDKCQNKRDCSGPGCRVRTGKTAEDRMPKAVRPRYITSPAMVRRAALEASAIALGIELPRGEA